MIVLFYLYVITTIRGKDPYKNGDSRRDLI